MKKLRNNMNVSCIYNYPTSKILKNISFVFGLYIIISYQKIKKHFMWMKSIYIIYSYLPSKSTL